MKLASPWKNKTHKSTGMGYVDDVTLGCTTNTPDIDNDNVVDMCETEEVQVVQDITKMGQSWEQMLHTNGGRLELKKCYWILVSWKWVQGIATLKKAEEVTATMKIHQSENNEDVNISRKGVDDAPKVLGCHISASGSWKVEVGKWIMEGAVS